MTINEDAANFLPRRIRSHRDLIVWRKAIDLAAESYRLASNLPDDENDVLGLRMHQASMSIAVNIAQGHGLTTKSFIRHLDNAVGSLAQLLTIFELATRLGYVDENRLSRARLLADEVGRMLQTLMGKLGAHPWE
jgi:four helix bundle protein